MNKRIFKLFANCVAVKGAAMATICDLQRGKVYAIPLDFIEFLEKTEANESLEVFNSYSKEDQETISEYYAFLEENELGFWTDEPKNYPELNMHWETPEHINNAILELEKLSYKDIEKIAIALKKLLCKFIEIRFYKDADLGRLQLFMEFLKGSMIRSCTVYLPYTEEFDLDKTENLLNQYPRITSIILHTIRDKEVKVANPQIRLITHKIDNRTHCGIIDPKLFAVNIPVFTESINFNSCLNKKIAIDQHGNIKNCPSMASNYGNINNTNIVDIARSKSFQQLWSITKDQINVCKDCEFRYVCTDCRAYLEDPKNILSKPLKCGYDPYKGVWENWSTNPLKQKVKEYYQMKF